MYSGFIFLISFPMSSKELNKSQPLIEGLSRLDLTSVSQLRPNALTDCTTNEIKRFIKEYSNYALHRGTASAISLVHRDVIAFYRYTYGTDLTSDKYTDSDRLIAFLKSTFGPLSSSDFLQLLSNLAMPTASNVNKDAINLYQLKFFALLEEHPAIKDVIDSEELVHPYFNINIFSLYNKILYYCRVTFI